MRSFGFAFGPLTCAGLLLGGLAYAESPALEEVRVWGQAGQDVASKGPSSRLLPEDLRSVNLATTEDLVKHQPSLVIRRRFIGDANGTLGIRGSNMFQTSRSMVFADGVPLHYFLQSRWNGAPRWTMVSASEIAQVETHYGPFSAEYSGNAMGGVVEIETAIPQGRELHIDGSFFSQDFSALGFKDDSLNGYKGFASYGDKIGDFSLYISYNRLENDAQPQSFFDVLPNEDPQARPVSGALPGFDEQGNEVLFFGDSGIVDSQTDNLKLKLGHDWENWSGLVNLAYEDRQSAADSPNTYIRNALGEPVYQGSFRQDGESFTLPASRLNVSEMNRQSLSFGLRLKGQLSEGLTLEANLNRFDILTDETRESAVNPQSPNNDGSGEITDFDDTGWRTAELKFTLEPSGLPDASLVTGARYEAYELGINVFGSGDYRAGQKDDFQASSGGKTSLSGLYAQFDWTFARRWDLGLGGRFDDWRSDNGFFSDDDPDSPQLDLERVPDQDRQRFSPKWSLGFAPDDLWQLRYSGAKAFRFPIVEELFSQFQAFNAINRANPDLKPEEGLHHNLMLERQFDRGLVKINLFQETIEEVIHAQTRSLPGGTSVRTFVPVDEVDTWGAEFIAHSQGGLHPKLDLRFNLTYTRAEIDKNSANPAFEGNEFPRMPDWRGNFIASYQFTRRWDLGGSVQYVSNSFNQLDNRDNQRNVFGAIDNYVFLGLKTNFQYNRHWRFSLGLDNITDEEAYVAHPWPGRTLHLSFSYDL